MGSKVVEGQCVKVDGKDIQIEEENREAVLNSGIAMNNLKKFI